MGWWAKENGVDIISDQVADTITIALKNIANEKKARSQPQLTLAELLNVIQVALSKKQKSFLLEGDTISIQKLIAELGNSTEVITSNLEETQSIDEYVLNQIVEAFEETTVYYEDSELERKPKLSEILASFAFVLGYDPEDYLSIPEDFSVSGITAVTSSK